MSLSNIITGLILIALFIVPYFIITRKRKKREEATLQSLSNLANQQQCNISKHEICGDLAIGMDETKKYVFFFKQLKDEVIEQYVSLAEIESCKVKKTARSVASSSGNDSVIDKLELCFIPSDKNKKEIAWEFFNADIEIQLNGQIQSIERWSTVIKDNLKSKK